MSSAAVPAEDRKGMASSEAGYEARKLGEMGQLVIIVGHIVEIIVIVIVVVVGILTVAVVGAVQGIQGGNRRLGEVDVVELIYKVGRVSEGE